MTNLKAKSGPRERVADPITELAMDLWWTWNHSTDELWRDLEPEMWEVTRNPWLTLGFARRFATYKRPNMLLHDPERLTRILSNAQRPVQLIVAGKAHPQDFDGQAMIKQWNEFIRRHDVRGHAVFLADYDALLAQELVAGVDVWINTPRRPWEACGTSGMKVLANGGLNVSELDGWWAEAYSPEVGWAIGDGKDRGYDPAWDKAEANALYSLLERSEERRVGKECRSRCAT